MFEMNKKDVTWSQGKIRTSFVLTRDGRRCFKKGFYYKTVLNKVFNKNMEISRLSKRRYIFQKALQKQL